ncbi:hypothetical protein [Aurantimonas sp. NFXS3]|uniref:hypothetical protein n=1 Tax=Aurantimonas sp. NFXS3 TaxID=2818434 RepID=UPI003B8EA722
MANAFRAMRVAAEGRSARRGLRHPVPMGGKPFAFRESWAPTAVMRPAAGCGFTALHNADQTIDNMLASRLWLRPKRALVRADGIETFVGSTIAARRRAWSKVSPASFRVDAQAIWLVISK